MPTISEKAWMAGFMDGEGCFTISKQLRKDRPSPSYRPFVTVCNTDKAVMQIFVDHYGGDLYEVMESRKDKRGAKWSDAYNWYCREGQILRFIADIRPYLRLKGAQADIVVEFIKTKDAFARENRTGKGSAPLSTEEIAHREALRLRIRSLNQKSRIARGLLPVVA